MVRKEYKVLNAKLDLLLKAHGIDFDDSDMDLASLEVLHAKTDTLLEAHNNVITEGNHSIADLHPKLNMLVREHGLDVDDYELIPNLVESARSKLDILLEVHKV
jgi:uncharacterized coiled-coil protein SlyX